MCNGLTLYIQRHPCGTEESTLVLPEERDDLSSSDDSDDSDSDASFRSFSAAWALVMKRIAMLTMVMIHVVRICLM